jgi:hypothetical protein
MSETKPDYAGLLATIDRITKSPDQYLCIQDAVELVHALTTAKIDAATAAEDARKLAKVERKLAKIREWAEKTDQGTAAYQVFEILGPKEK